MVADSEVALVKSLVLAALAIQAIHRREGIVSRTCLGEASTDVSILYRYGIGAFLACACFC